jgi:hypothetical protein
MTIDRRLFLKMSGVVAAAGALASVPSHVFADGEDLRSPGIYQITGRVRLRDSTVSISGITNAQTISWTPGSLTTPVTTFTSFERFDRPWRMPAIRVEGGQLEAMQVLPLEFS